MSPFRSFSFREACSSLKLRLAVAGIAALVTAVGLTSARQLTLAEADLVRASLSTELGEAVRSARLLSRRAVEQQKALALVAQGIDANMLHDARALAAFARLQSVARTYFDSLVFVDAVGVVRAFSSDGADRGAVHLGDRAYFRDTMAQKRPLISRPLMSRLSDHIVVAFTQPLMRGNEVFGVLVGAMRLQRQDLLSGLTDTFEDQEGALVVVTDALGRIIAHPDRALIGGPLSTEPMLAESFARWQEQGSAIEPAGLAMEVESLVVGAAGVPGAEWMVWRARQKSSVTAPIAAARANALRWAAVLVAAMSAGLVALLWWTLRPLGMLQRRARHLFDGTLGAQEGWPTVGGEIGQLQHVLRHVASERSQLEAFNGQVLRQLESVMSAAPVGIAFVRNERFELSSAEFCRLFGRPAVEIVGQLANLVFASAAEFGELSMRITAAFSTGLPYVGEWQLLHADGSRFWARLRCGAVDAADIDAGWIWTINDVTDEVAEREALAWSASHDALTGLANRKAFEQRMARVFDALPWSLPASLIVIDLDSFKPINDTFGHAAGDAMLCAVAQAAAACARGSDLLVRVGGDEFAVVLERCPHDVAMRVAEDMRAAIAAIALRWDGRVLRLSASLGVASLSAGMPSFAAWLQAADLACYAAKAAGRNAVHSALQRPPAWVEQEFRDTAAAEM